MPDWVTHLGTTYLAAHAVERVKPAWTRSLDPRFLLLGALLPDVSRFTIIPVDVLKWPAMPTFTYLIPFHSLLIAGLLAGAIALLLPIKSRFQSSQWLTGSRGAFGLIMSGASFHFLLDDLEGLVGCGSTTFYPFYFGKPLNLWDSEGQLAALLLIVSAIALGLVLARQYDWPRLRLHLTRRRLVGAVALVSVALVLPLFFRQWMVERNAYSLGFVTQPAAFEGQNVEFCFSEVIATTPLTIEEFDQPYVLLTPAVFTVGEWVSVRGVVDHGAIRPTTLVRHHGFSDITFSLVAAVVFVVLMFGGISKKAKE